MSIRFTNAPTIFQELINHILYDYLDDFMIAYLDNIFIYLKIKKEHEKHVKKIL